MINRRELLKHAGAVSLAGIGSSFISLKDVEAADYKALVVVFLSGGHDGNNVLVPLDGAYSEYAKARPALALPKDSLVRLSGSHIGHTFGLSPASRAMAAPACRRRLSARPPQVARASTAIGTAQIASSTHIKPSWNTTLDANHARPRKPATLIDASAATTKRITPSPVPADRARRR